MYSRASKKKDTLGTVQNLSIKLIMSFIERLSFVRRLYLGQAKLICSLSGPNASKKQAGCGNDKYSLNTKPQFPPKTEVLN